MDRHSKTITNAVARFSRDAFGAAARLFQILLFIAALSACGPASGNTNCGVIARAVWADASIPLTDCAGNFGLQSPPSATVGVGDWISIVSSQKLPDIQTADPSVLASDLPEFTATHTADGVRSAFRAIHSGKTSLFLPSGSAYTSHACRTVEGAPIPSASCPPASNVVVMRVIVR